MAIVPFVNFTSLVIVIMVMFTLDIFGYMMKVGVPYIAAGCLGLYTLGSIFNQQFITNQTVYDGVSASFKTNNVDPNLGAVIMVIMTIFSFYFIYWERTTG